MNNTNVEIKRNQNENSANVLRRFQKKIQESGILQRVRGLRYNERKLSDLKTKKAKLIKLEGKKEYERLKKLGKLVDRRKR